MSHNSSMSHRWGDLLSAATLVVASALGLWGLFRPLFLSAGELGRDAIAGAGSEQAPVLIFGLLALCLVVVVGNLETRRMDARSVALLGVLVGISACLRLVSGPLGASGSFLLPILCGYAFGADFGFLLGALAMLMSALLTGGIGPWLPFQMFGVGWCGMVAGWLPQMPGRYARSCALLAVWGVLSAFVFGALMNLWIWPFLTPDVSDHSFAPGQAWKVTAARFGAYYLATSSWWDAGRAVANGVLLLVGGPPILRLFERFQRRLQFETAGRELSPDRPLSPSRGSFDAQSDA